MEKSLLVRIHSILTDDLKMKWRFWERPHHEQVALCLFARAVLIDELRAIQIRGIRFAPSVVDDQESLWRLITADETCIPK